MASVFFVSKKRIIILRLGIPLDVYEEKPFKPQNAKVATINTFY